MKYFLDTEFIESSGGVQLVSLGIVREDGETFYAESIDFNPELADQWVKDNVLSKLLLSNARKNSSMWGGPVGKPREIVCRGTEVFIKNELLEWITEEDPEFYAYFASYDWVVFARIFGRLIDKPPHFPMWVIDLKQMMWERDLTKDWKREHCPDPEGEHNALQDAIWNMKLWKLILSTGIQVA